MLPDFRKHSDGCACFAVTYQPQTDHVVLSGQKLKRLLGVSAGQVTWNSGKVVRLIFIGFH